MQKTDSINHNLGIICFVCLMLLPSILFAKTYKWVDSDGNIHYTQSPPAGDIKVEVIEPPSSVDEHGALETLGKKNERADKLREQRLTATKEKLKSREDAAEKEKDCQQAISRLASYQYPRILMEDSDGTSRILPEEERQAEIKKSQEYIKNLCN